MNRYVVSRELLERNISELKKRAKGVPIWAVIKGDGYGLGALPLAELLREQGIDHFCVTELREAELLRENGFTNEAILMLRELQDRETLRRLMDHKVILTVGSTETAEIVDDLAAHRSEIACVHLKIDTGMGRYGFFPGQLEEVTQIFRQRKNLAVCGIYTHFNCAFNNETLTRREFDLFMQIVTALRTAGLDTGTVHCCNSSAFLKYPEMHMDGVRLGSALLGRMSFSCGLQPVGYAESHVEAIRSLPSGHSTGYGAMWRAKKETKVAILPVGWYHGFQVSCKADLSRKRDCFRTALSALKSILRRPYAYVLIRGKKCRVIGAIGMLHCAVDVSHIPCEVGDLAELQINPLHIKGMPVVYREV